MVLLKILAAVGLVIFAILSVPAAKIGGLFGVIIGAGVCLVVLGLDRGKNRERK